MTTTTRRRAAEYLADRRAVTGQGGVAACHLTYGWPTWVPPDSQAHSVEDPDLPPEVLATQRYARGLGRD